MDWYSWLSKTNLDQTLVYEYGIAFVRNELQEEDLAYFNHDFLQSLGISVAKHRLEILKLSRKEVRGRINGFSKLVVVMNKTMKLFTRNISKLGFHRNSWPAKLSPYGNQWSGALRRINGERNVQQQEHKAAVISRRNMMWSGPLDKRAQDKFLLACKNQSVSGPLDVKMQEKVVNPHLSPMVMRPNGRLGLVCRSPTISGPIDRLGLSPQMRYYGSAKVGDDHEHATQSLWSIMFQDLKPT
ncbi:hypothetical protein ACS0TY_024204 [Phlomoides rotata]